MDIEQACVAAHDLPSSWTQSAPGEQLRALRESRGISQRHLAEESGVDQSDIGRIERGADARLSTWKRLFGALGFDAMLAPLPISDDAEDFLRDELQRRQERMEAGRMRRW